MRAFVSVLLGGAVAAAPACGSSRNAPAAASEPAAAAPAAPSQNTLAAPSDPTAAPLAPRAPARPGWTPMPEDPVAAKQSFELWRAHQLHEQDERQLWFDRQRLAQHRALLKQLAAARAQYDRVRRTVDVAKAQAQVEVKLAQIEERMKALESGGNSSRVLPEYQALLSILSAYPYAKGAELEGEKGALDAKRAAFDQRVATIKAWLERAEHEAEEEGGEDPGRAQP